MNKKNKSKTEIPTIEIPVNDFEIINGLIQIINQRKNIMAREILAEDEQVKGAK